MVFKNKIRSLCLSFIVLAVLLGPILAPQVCFGASRFPFLDPATFDISASYPDLDKNAVVPNLAVRIADDHAKRVLDKRSARGQPFLIHRKDGTPLAYVVPYALKNDVFPSNDRIFEAIRSLKEKHPRTGKRFDQALKNSIGSMGCIEVAVSRSDFPVLVVRYSLHPAILNYEEALAEARKRLGEREVTLKNVEYNGPHELYFNFISPSGNLKLHAHTLVTLEEMCPAVRVPEFLASNGKTESEVIKHRRVKAWKEIEEQSHEPLDDVFRWIENYALIPVVDWTHWCVPTAWTMTAGYWDHYVPGIGTWPGYGRIIDYWFDHPAICQNSTVTNVPNLIDEMIVHTGNCSWSEYGLIGSLNTLNGYNFSSTDIKGTEDNDWCWPNIVAEVEKGRPFVWGVGPVNGHAMTAWGYRTVGTQKFVRVYNTWGSTAEAQTAEYNYDQWSGAPNTQTGVGLLTPGGAAGTDHAVLHYPRGGETVFGSTEISWFVWGDNIAYTRVYFSSDGGTTWNSVHTSWFLATTGGWNTYTADLNTSTSKGRIKIECFTSDLTYIAGDGSPNHFIVQGKADLIPITTCSKDGEGNILIKVKNNGAVQSNPSVARVTFYPSGVEDLQFPAIAPGETAQVPVTAPGSCWNPDCDYQIQVDIYNSVDESDETNNTGQGACIS